MSRLFNIGTFLGGLGGCVIGGLGIFQYFDPTALETMDEIVFELSRIGDAFEEQGLTTEDLSEGDARTVATALLPFSKLLSFNLSGMTNEELQQFGPAATFGEVGQVIFIQLPNGELMSATFQGYNQYETIFFYLDGVSYTTKSGGVFRPDAAQPCKLLVIGRTEANPETSLLLDC